jgi:alkanesulfonate monooxygenase SsuD/methylene tetrahydromethanopterin reductase-like flavin-dependent oxidoreductase (luciferase family)
VRFSLMTEPHLGGTYDQMLAAARIAESRGLVSFARCDHYLTERDPTPDASDAFVTLAGLARDTEAIRLCVLVTPITFRHPAVIAKSAAGIDQMSGGRFDLGLGTGWMEFEHNSLGIEFPEWPERWERFEEAIGYLEAAFGPGRSRFEGKHYWLDADVEPKPLGIRLIIGGGGARRTPTLAGARADEYNFFVCPASEAADRIATMRESAQGRNVEATVMGPVIVGKDDADYRERLERFTKAFGNGREPEQIESRYRAMGAILGTPSQVEETVAGLAHAGVDRIYLQWLDLGDPEGIESMLDLMLT